MKGCPLGISGFFLIRWVYALPRALGSWGEGGNTVQGPSCKQNPGVFSQTPSPQSKLQVRAAAGLPGSLLRPQTWLQASQTGGCADSSSPCSCPHHTHTQLRWRKDPGPGRPSVSACPAMSAPDSWGEAAGNVATLSKNQVSA